VREYKKAAAIYFKMTEAEMTLAIERTELKEVESDAKKI
jgi:hypothetical protein